jgi:hypothetical protein
VIDEGVERADRVGAATHARRDRVRQRAGELEDLRAGLDADDAGEVADHRGERVRTRGGAEQVVGVLDIGDPVADRLVDGVLEGARAGGDRDDLGAEHAHPGHVQRLPLGVLLTHVDHAFEVEQGGGGGRGDAVLAGPGFGDDPVLAHPLGQQCLPEHIVDLVRAGVVEVLALEQDARPGVLGQPLGLGQQRGPVGVGAQPVGELGVELRVVLGLLVGLGELGEGGHQRLGHEAAAQIAVVPGGIGLERGMGVRRGEKGVGKGLGVRHRTSTPGEKGRR